MNFLDNAFSTLTRSFMSGYNNLEGWINGLLGLLFLIDLLFLAVKWMLGIKDVKESVNKILNCIVWYLAVLIFPYFMDYVQRVAALVGQAAGTPAAENIVDKLKIAAMDLLHNTKNGMITMPSSILSQGLANAMPLLDASNNWMYEMTARFFYLICWFLMMISYVIMTV